MTIFQVIWGLFPLVLSSQNAFESSVALLFCQLQLFPLKIYQYQATNNTSSAYWRKLTALIGISDERPFFDNQNEHETNSNRFGFESVKNPPLYKVISTFKNDLYNLA